MSVWSGHCHAHTLILAITLYLGINTPPFLSLFSLSWELTQVGTPCFLWSPGSTRRSVLTKIQLKPQASKPLKWSNTLTFFPHNPPHLYPSNVYTYLLSLSFTLFCILPLRCNKLFDRSNLEYDSFIRLFGIYLTLLFYCGIDLAFGTWTLACHFMSKTIKQFILQ